MLKVKDTDTECEKRKGTINPFAPPRDKEEFYKTKGKRLSRICKEFKKF